MDQIKIGKFIAKRRKLVNLTQMQLAEKLNITDRAVSKWETGKSLPDSSIMLELCEILKISVNDLLCGEIVQMENYNKELENNLLEMVQQKQKADKRLLKIEIALSIIAFLPLVTSAIIASVVPMEEWIASLMVGICVIPALIAAPFALKIEQKAGYYKCAKCSHRYVPKYSQVFFAMHVNRTRYMRCPKCNKFSWQKKVISKE